jgi:hypothetical protein
MSFLIDHSFVLKRTAIAAGRLWGVGAAGLHNVVDRGPVKSTGQDGQQSSGSVSYVTEKPAHSAHVGLEELEENIADAYKVVLSEESGFTPSGDIRHKEMTLKV